MPGMEATMAWAIPVDIEALGPNLEAYVNLLPTLNTLRLCHRYGKGPHARIVDMPAELIVSIEDFIILDERLRLQQEWSAEFACFLQACDPSDHLSSDELERYNQMERDGILLDLFEHFKNFGTVHAQRRFAWEMRVGVRSATGRGMFTANEELVRTHFGLEIWITHVRLEEYMFSNFWEMTEEYPPETTVAYLKLPGSKVHERGGVLSRQEREDKDFMIESGYAMPIKIPKALSSSARKKFRRMIKILDLWRALDGSQQDMDLRAEESVDDGSIESQNSKSSNGNDCYDRILADYRSGKWTSKAEPQLTMLVRCTTRSDEEG